MRNCFALDALIYLWLLDLLAVVAAVEGYVVGLHGAIQFFTHSIF